MPLRCTLRPNRSHARVFKARDAARIICYAVRSGATHGEIDAEADRLCPDESRTRREGNAAAQAIAALQANNSILSEGIALASVLLGVLFAAQGLVRFLPGPARVIALPVTVALRTAINRVNGSQVTMIARRAANDELIVVLQKAA